MRIEGNLRTGGVAARVGGRSAASGSGFTIGEGASAAATTPVHAAAATTGIDALLALQAVEDPLTRRRRLVRRGATLLETLETIRADLLAGEVGEADVGRLRALVGEGRDRGEPGLDALLDDIELRARVELAKRGVYLPD